MDKNQKAILIELMSRESISGMELSSFIKMSTRTVRTLIKHINDEITGAKIESGHFGYTLVIEDPELLLAYLQQDEIPQDHEDRLQYLLERFMDNQGYIKIDELCEELYISRTQVKQSLKELRNYLKIYDLAIMTKAHYGMYLSGLEVNKRRAIAHFNQYQKDMTIYQNIKNIVISCMVNEEYQVSDDILDNLVSHLYIAYIRIQKQEYARMDTKWLQSIQKEKEYALANSIMTLLSSMMDMEYRKEEVAYLTMHLCGKNCKQNTKVYIAQDILHIVEEILCVIQQESSIPFTSDLNLQLALALHLIPLLKRIKYQTYMHNPLLQEIKRNLIVAYELAVKASTVINQEYHCALPEDEIAYFALHINLSLEQKKTTIQKKNILLICSSGVGSARLLEYFFKENFHSYIAKLDVCSLHELSNYDTNQYDCIFTTVDIHQDIDIPIFLISNLISAKDTITISKNLKQLHQKDIMQYFPKQLFFTYDAFESKEEAIHEIVKQCHRYYDLPENFEQLILEREMLSSTEFSDLVAFPHSHKPVSTSTFVSVTVLKKPLVWKQHKIRIILLSSIENKLVKELDDFYRTISVFMSDQILQWQLLNQPTYSNFQTIIEKVANK